MSEKHIGSKRGWLDTPDQTPLKGQLTEMYAVIDNALDNGEITVRTMRQAQAIGREVLDRYTEARVPWQVYGELTLGMYSELHKTTDSATLRKLPTNIIGNVSDIEIRNEDDCDEAILALSVESRGIGQADTYSIPVAYARDTQIPRNRPVDFPELIREAYGQRLTEEEKVVIGDFYDVIKENGISARELIQYIEEMTDDMRGDTRNRYMTALSLELEDAYGSDCPYRVKVCDAKVETLYSHADSVANSQLEYLEGGAWCDVTQIDYDHTTEDEGVAALALIVSPQDNDKLIKIPLEADIDITLYRPNIDS